MECMVEIKDIEFREKHLELGDVWTWSTDLHESEDALVLLTLTEEVLASADSLLIRSHFTTALGNSMQGLIVYAVGSNDVFAIEVLIADQKFTFNQLASALSHAELRRLALHLGEDANALLPIKYCVATVALNIAPGLFSF
jgi:hypothetical protein